MVIRLLAFLFAVALILEGQIPAEAQPATSDWAGAAFGQGVKGPSSNRAVSADDLVRLRDIGALTLSPDGRRLAFPVWQAVPEQNAYQMRWFVTRTNGRSVPEALTPDGGQPISSYAYGLPLGYIWPPVAKWSPDSSSIAFRRQIDHRIELWIVNLETGANHMVADGTSQVVDFVWESNGTLVFRTGLNYADYEKSVDAEAATGWLLDTRINAFSSHVRPTEPECSAAEPPAACKVRTLAVKPGNPARPATAEEAAILSQEPADAEAGSLLPQTRLDGAVVKLELTDPTKENAATPLKRLTMEARNSRACNVLQCEGARFKAFGWARSGSSIWFVKSESSLGNSDGYPGDLATLYEWVVKSGRVRKILQIDGGVLENCHAALANIYCLKEELKSPRQVVAINLDTKEVVTIADANPMFSEKDYPRIKKIILHDSEGNVGFAHVVYPNAYREGTKYPLVVTQYNSRGFLRGQVGNEYPIYPLAASGYVVMSVNWPTQSKIAMARSYADLGKSYTEDGRRLVWSAIEGGVDQLIREGIVDGSKTAITGLSGGAELVHYILQRSGRFTAAIASSGVQDVTFFALIHESPRKLELMKSYNVSSVIPPIGNVIYSMAWSSRPEALKTPLLINVGEYEAMIGFEGIQSILRVGGPLEERIFPDEQHLKYHPRSIAGVYRNNVQWLNFWLKGEEDPNPLLADQYRRWEAMRRSIKVSGSVGSAGAQGPTTNR